jgi:outer membrane protein
MNAKPLHGWVAAALLTLAGQVHAVDLLESWNAARTVDPTFGAARAGVDVGHSKTAQAKALGLPQVSLQAGAGGINSYNKISNARFAAPGMGAADSASFTTQTDMGVDVRWNLNLTQSVLDAERSTAQRQLAKQAQLADVQYSAEEQQLMLRVAKSYLDVLLAEDALDAIQRQSQAVTHALDSAKERFKEGDVAVIDVREAQARADALASQRLEAESSLQLARAALSDISGLNGDLSHLPESADLQGFAAGDLNDWVMRAKRSSLALQMQEIRQGIATDEIEKHRNAHAPVLNLVAQAGGEELRGIGGGADSGLTNHAVSIGMQLTIPLFTGGMRDAKYGEAMALAEQSRQESEAARIRAAQAARTAWTGVTVGQSRIKALEQALQSSQTKLDATGLGKEVGDRTTLDVLNAVQDAAETRRELNRAKYQLLLSYLGLAASAGELGEKQMTEVNAVLAETRH